MWSIVVSNINDEKYLVQLIYLFMISCFLSEPKLKHFNTFPSSLFLSVQELSCSLSSKRPLVLVLLEVKHTFYIYSMISHVVLYGICLVDR